MAITRIPRKLKTFEYEGLTYGLRKPRVEEVMEITRMLSKYQRSVKQDIKSDVADGIIEYNTSTGDVTLMTQTQRYIAETLCIDVASGGKIFGKGEEYEDINDVPGDFILAAWTCYTEDAQKKAADAAKTPEGDGDEKRIDPLEVTAPTTTSSSDETSLSSPSSSTLTLVPSATGNGPTS